VVAGWDLDLSCVDRPGLPALGPSFCASPARVKWRHAAEVLVAGYAANFACRAGWVSSFELSFGSIVVERVCDGLVLVCTFWISVGWILSVRFEFVSRSWIFLVGAISVFCFCSVYRADGFIRTLAY